MRKQWTTVVEIFWYILFVAIMGHMICRSHIPDYALELYTNINIALFLLYFVVYTIGLMFYRSPESKLSCLHIFYYIMSIIVILMLIFPF